MIRRRTQPTTYTHLLLSLNWGASTSPMAELRSACNRVLGRLQTAPADGTTSRRRCCCTTGSHCNPSRAHNLPKAAWAKVGSGLAAWAKEGLESVLFQCNC